jgi:glycosyltransferase involved in cell wall biosynthesis
MMPQEPSMGISPTESLVSHIKVAGFNDEDINKLIAVNGGNIYKGEVSEQDVNAVYNLSNYNITTTLGEGFGLSLIESMATGTKSIAPNNSVISEILANTGYLVKNKMTYSFQNDNGFVATFN